MFQHYPIEVISDPDNIIDYVYSVVPEDVSNT